MRHFHDPNIAAVAPVVVRRDNRSLVVSAGLGYRAEGAAWRIGQRKELTDVAARKVVPYGPDLLAAFFRKSALESVRGFAPWSGESFVGVDLALALHHAGLRCVLEPNCLAHVDNRIISEKPRFSRGRDAERLFWRWASFNGWMRSLAGHTAMLTGECITSLLRPTMIGQLVGRAWGVTQAILQDKQSLPQGLDLTVPTILPGPHFAEANDRDKIHPSTRVA